MIELKGISKIYEMKKTDDVKALDNVSITFPSKGMVFVLGKSGSGKSTLLNVAGGLDQYTSGDLIIKGKSTKNFKQSDFDSYRNTMIGFIFQEYNILEEFTVAQNIGLALELQGKKATSEEISAILEQVDLAGYGTRKPNELSGGQRQRVAIARALVKQPEVIMADEPTGALDSTTSKQVFETLKKLSETRLVLIVSHDRDYAESYGDRIVEFSDGVIISDTTKNENPDVEKHLTFEDNKLNIKSGYELTEEDIRIINEYLQTEKEALFIDKLGRASFDKTDLSTIVTDPNSQYVPIKSKLPFRSSLKIGASALKHRKVRLVIAILLSSISFALFGLADTMGAYNKVNVTTHSMVDSNVNYISLKKERHVKQGNWTRVDTLKLTLDDVAEFNALDSSLHFIPIYKQYEWDRYSFGNSLDKNVPNEAQYYYHPYFYGYAEVDTATLTKFGYTMSVGRLPQADDEAAIPLEAFELFKLLGYKDLSFNVIRINNPSDMLNKIINVDGKQFKVVGVVDTKFDKSRYDTLKEVDFSAGSFKYYFISNELSTVLRTSLHQALFVNEGYASTAMAFDGVILRDNYINMSFEYNGNTSYVETLKNIDDLEPDDYVLLDGVTPSIINNGGVFISSRMFSDVYYFDDWEDTLHYHVEQAVQAFVNAEVTANRITLEQIKQALQLAGYSDEFLQNDVGDWEEWEKHNAINYFTYEFYNEYAPRHNYPGSYNEIKRDVEAAFFTSIPTFDIDLETTTYRYDYVSKTDRVQVLGIIKVNEGTSYEDYYKIAVNEETYDSLIEVEDGVYLNIVSPFLNKDAKLIEKFVKKHYSEDEIVYILQNEVTATLSEVNSLFETLGKVFLYIGIGFAVFSAIMLLNFITVSVSYKKKEIGILRAIGARGSDVRGIFTKESTIISLINFVIAFALTLGTVITLNSLLRNEYSLSITLLNFGVRQIGLMLGISLFIGYISSAIPVVKVSRRRPIEAIKDL